MKYLLPMIITIAIAVAFVTAQKGCHQTPPPDNSEAIELRKRVMEAEATAEQLAIELAYLSKHQDTVVRRYYSSRDIVKNTFTTDTIYRDVCLTALNDCDSALHAAESIVNTQDSIISVKDNIIGLNSAQISNSNRTVAELGKNNLDLNKKVKRLNVGVKVLMGMAAVFGIIAIVK